MATHLVFEGQDVYERILKNDVKVDDEIHYLPNNQEGIEKYLVKETDGKKYLERLPDYVYVEEPITRYEAPKHHIVWEGQDVYERMLKNDVKVDDEIHYLPNNQEGIEKYLVKETDGKKYLERLPDYVYVEEPITRYKTPKHQLPKIGKTVGKTVKKTVRKTVRKGGKRCRTRKSKKTRKPRRH